ncbi:MAG: glycosyltransferase family 4 protein [Actinobacteria bacterium]|nr:glycosyltransferase family 4 protein [Actinomycetota bacterium]
MRLVVVTPHFAPDVAPTGEVITRLVGELGARGHAVEVITSFPWYRDHRIEPGYGGRLTRHEDTPWGHITRVSPFATADKRNIARRAAAFAGFSALAAAVGSRGERADAVLAVSPPLTLGATGYAIAKARGAAFVFNVQDVYPDVAVRLGVLTNRPVIAAATALEHWCYGRADAITVLSRELEDNVSAKIAHGGRAGSQSAPGKIHVIPNFVDTDAIRPAPRDNSYRSEFDLRGKRVVMYAGNVGLSQSMHTVLDAAAALEYDDDIVFVINGQGAARTDAERRATGLRNVRFVDMQPSGRLADVLAAADVHLVPLKRGLAASSVPSKVYSILAAGRPVVASVDEGSEVSRLVEEAKAGIAVPPEDSEALTKAIKNLFDSPEEAASMGQAGRSFVEGSASPTVVAEAYEALFAELARA